jgi:hypothetical protein
VIVFALAQKCDWLARRFRLRLEGEVVSRIEADIPQRVLERVLVVERRAAAEDGVRSL